MSRTGIPLVNGLRWTSLSLVVGCLAIAVAGSLLGSPTIFDGSPGDSLTLIAAVPMFLLAHHFARQARLRAASLSLFGGFYVLSLAGTAMSGQLTPGWYLQPLLALVVTSALGPMSGLLLTMVSAFAILVAPWLHGFGTIGVSAAAVTLVAGLIGVLINRLLCVAVCSSAELQQREKILSHALRVETVGDLAGMVVHRLRNHFQVILGHVMLGSRSDGEEQSRHLEMIGSTLDDASPLLDQLLGLAHPEQGEPRPSDLTGLAGDFVTKVRRILPASIELEQRVASAPLPVLVDPRGLEAALLNLVINARDAMGERGSLVLATGSREGQVWVSVRDTGPGIASEDLDRIFDPYFTTKPVGQGTGLGLTAVSLFVDACRGHIRVDSGAEGTTFTLAFPRLVEGSGATGRAGRATG